MSFFGKFKKEDLRITAEELGIKTSSDMKMVDLRNAILESDIYEEEFVKELLTASKESRERRMQVELEEKARQFELEKTRLQMEEKEKQRQVELEEKARQFELEKTKLQMEEAKIQMEEKEKQRQFELEKLRMGVGNQIEQATEIINPNVTKVELQKLLPKFNSEKDDITLFLTLFERQAKFLAIPEENWASLVIGVLPSEIGCIIARESEELMKDYEKVKEVLLNRFKMTPERLHKMFLTLNKDLTKTWYDFYYELKSYLEGWLQGLNVTTLKQFKDLIIAEQMKRKCPPGFRDHHIEEWALLISPVELAKKLDNYENVMDSSSKKISTQIRTRPFQEQNKDFNQDKRNSQQDFETQTKIDGRKSPTSEFYEARKKLRCYVCGSFNHLKPQCPELRKSTQMKATINKIGEPHEEELLSPYILKGKVNGIELPILRDTGATIDVISRKYIKPEMLTGETVLVRQPLDEGPKCLPIAKVKIEGKFGKFYTKAAVIRSEIDQGRYLLGNKTAAKINEMSVNRIPKVDSGRQQRNSNSDWLSDNGRQQRNTDQRSYGQNNSRTGGRRMYMDDKSSEMVVDSSLVGKIIGKGGSKIRELQDESEAYIKVLKNDTGAADTSIRLSGSPEAIEKAKTLIEDLISGVSNLSTQNNWSNKYTNPSELSTQSSWNNKPSNNYSQPSNEEHLVLYIRKKVSDAEKKYSTTEKRMRRNHLCHKKS